MIQVLLLTAVLLLSWLGGSALRGDCPDPLHSSTHQKEANRTKDRDHEKSHLTAVPISELIAGSMRRAWGRGFFVGAVHFRAKRESDGCASVTLSQVPPLDGLRTAEWIEREVRCKADGRLKYDRAWTVDAANRRRKLAAWVTNPSAASDIDRAAQAASAVWLAGSDHDTSFTIVVSTDTDGFAALINEDPVGPETMLVVTLDREFKLRRIIHSLSTGPVN